MHHPPGEYPQFWPQPDPRLDLRVSHDDREGVAERLRQAAGEGRLDVDELSERLGSALSARTYRLGRAPTVTRFPAVLGDRRRTGRCVVPGHYTATGAAGQRAAGPARGLARPAGGDDQLLGPPRRGPTAPQPRPGLPPPPPGGPVVRVTGTVVLGEVTIERHAPGRRRVRRRRRGHGTS